MPPGLELATVDDIGDLVEFLRGLHAECGIGPLNIPKATENIRLCMPDRLGVTAVSRVNGDIVAAVGLLTDTPWYGDQVFLKDLFFFVHPAHRHSLHAQRLLLFAKQAARSVRLSLILTVLTNKDTAAKERFFGRHLRSGGRFFVMEAAAHG
jgi:GNAT superfamily N-acetyltransferase